MQLLQPTDTYEDAFETHDTTGALADATGTPAIIVNHLGTDDGTAGFTATKIATGTYRVTGTRPSYFVRDKASVRWTATVGGIACGGKLDAFQIVNSPATDLLATIVRPAAI